MGSALCLSQTAGAGAGAPALSGSPSAAPQGLAKRGCERAWAWPEAPTGLDSGFASAFSSSPSAGRGGGEAGQCDGPSEGLGGCGAVAVGVGSKRKAVGCAADVRGRW